MFNIFYVDIDAVTINLKYQKLDFISNKITNEKQKVKSYYQNSHRYVERPNIFIKLLYGLEIGLETEPNEIWEKAEINGKYIANELGLVVDVNRNDKSSSNNIMENVSEYYIVINEITDLFNMDITNYDQFVPIKCLYSNVNELILTHPKMYQPEIAGSDIFVYSVNVPMLALQYYFWLKEQILLERDTDAARFLYTVAFNNIIDSIFDITMVNRILYGLEYELEDSELINYNKFYIPNLTKMVDSFIIWNKDIIKKKRGKMKIDTFLSSIKTPSESKTIYDILELPYIYNDKRTIWLYWLIRSTIVGDIISLLDERFNKDYINNVEYEFKKAKRNRIFSLEDNTTKIILESNIIYLKNTLRLKD